MPLHTNECQHKVYLGSDKSADYYLYIDDADMLAICKRTGHLGDYETIPSKTFFPSKTNEKFLKELKSIVSFRGTR
jgi:hypothetical protein